MYEEMTEPNINPLAGECSHKCKYCYVDDMKVRPFAGAKYSGEPRIHEKAMKPVNGGTRFLCSCNDLFADGVPIKIIERILDWAAYQKTVTWWIQSKNPQDMLEMVAGHPIIENSLFGTTIETNRGSSDISKAPPPSDRAITNEKIKLDYITIEPIMDFDLKEFVELIKIVSPKFVNVGANSGRVKLPEPPPEKVKALIHEMEKFTEVKIKPNLKRILGADQ